MIIWRGKGFVIALIAFACLILSEFLTETAFSDNTYYQTHGWPKLVGLWVAALIVYKLWPWFGVRAAQVLVDRDTGQGVHVASSEGALFFVPARFWPQILLVLGLIFLFVKG